MGSVCSGASSTLRWLLRLCQNLPVRFDLTATKHARFKIGQNGFLMTCRDSRFRKRILVLRVNVIISRCGAYFGIHDLLIGLYRVEICSTLWFLWSWIKLFVSSRRCNSTLCLRFLLLLSWSSLLFLAVREGAWVSLIDHHLICTFLQTKNVRIRHQTTCSSLHRVGVEQTRIPEILILGLHLLNRFAFVVRIRSVQRGNDFYLLCFILIFVFILGVLVFCSSFNSSITVGSLINCGDAISCLVKLLHLGMGKGGPTRLACFVYFDLHLLVYYVYLNIVWRRFLGFKLKLVFVNQHFWLLEMSTKCILI